MVASILYYNTPQHVATFIFKNVFIYLLFVDIMMDDQF